MPVYRETLTFRDAKGQTARVSFYCTAATFAAATPLANTVATDMEALTNSAISQATGPYTLIPSPVVYGGAGQFQDSSDKAALSFTTATGAIHRYQVPAPLAAIFLADLETVDPSNAAVTAFVAAMEAVACSRDGSAITTFIGGIRLRRKMPRRFNIFTKNPAETGPGE